jgi:hypothetical protein
MRSGYQSVMILALLACAAGEVWLGAQRAAWQPSAGLTQVPIWPGVIPDARPVDGPEVAGWVEDPADRAKKHLVGAHNGAVGGDVALDDRHHLTVMDARRRCSS